MKFLIKAVWILLLLSMNVSAEFPPRDQKRPANSSYMPEITGKMVFYYVDADANYKLVKIKNQEELEAFKKWLKSQAQPHSLYREQEVVKLNLEKELEIYCCDLIFADRFQKAEITEKVVAAGEFLKPAPYDLEAGGRLSDLVDLAGGVEKRADKRMLIVLREGNAYAFNLQMESHLKLKLKGGDIVFLNQVGFLY